MQRRTFLGLLLSGSASLGLAGCGYRLRGLDSPGPALSELAIAGSDSDFAEMVRDRLESSDTHVHAQAPLVLNLGAEAFRERPLGTQGTGPASWKWNSGCLLGSTTLRRCLSAASAAARGRHPLHGQR
ncbi:LPS-assembly lipoprotein LptE [Halomonas sp. BC04]|uniref:LPS-assembly lipoprotein LptE n=1 Tax=Halomonas sp. BC04 TaxID=1403540 RepID=UPI001E40A24D|nr:hypothetical protein [Halomonas sp. BC04]